MAGVTFFCKGLFLFTLEQSESDQAMLFAIDFAILLPKFTATVLENVTNLIKALVFLHAKPLLDRIPIAFAKQEKSLVRAIKQKQG